MPDIDLDLDAIQNRVSPHSWTHVKERLQLLKDLLVTTGLDYVNVQQYGLRVDRTRSHANLLNGAILVRNASGGAIAAYDLLYVSGTYTGTSNIPSVAKAIATATASTNYRAVLVADAAISDGADGTAYLAREISGVDTSGSAVGDPVYLSTVAGAWTLTRPTANQFVQVVGYVSVVHASTGRVILIPEDGNEDFLFGAAGGLGIWLDANRDSGLLASAADTLDVYLNNAADFRFTANLLAALDGSSVVVGHTAAITTSAAGTLQVLGTAAADSTAVIGRWSADASGPVLSLVKSRNAAIGSSTIIQNDDVLGTVEFMADDGGDFATPGATIFARVNGTPGANDLPTELVFATTADAGNTVTERMFLVATGRLGIGIGTPDGTLHVHTATAGSITAHSSADDLVVENSGGAGITILTPSTATGAVYFGDEGSATAAQINYDHNTTKMWLRAEDGIIYLMSTGNFKVGGSAAVRATTEGTNHLDIFDGTAPAGTLANGISLYSTSGECRVMDASGNATLISPHPDDFLSSLPIEGRPQPWAYDCANVYLGTRVMVDLAGAIAQVEALTGKTFVFVEELEGPRPDWDEDQEMLRLKTQQLQFDNPDLEVPEYVKKAPPQWMKLRGVTSNLN